MSTEAHTPSAGHGHSIPTGRVFGISLRLHWTFFLLIPFVTVVDWSYGTRSVLLGLLWVAALFSFVTAHEMAHCVIAQQRGARVIGIVLFPLGGLSQLEEMPKAPNDELAVAIAGPMFSLVMGVLLVAVGLLLGSHMWPPTLFVGSWWARIGWLNLLLGAFNMLPALPMDGGRVLRASLARHRSTLEATEIAGRIARYLGVAMIAVGLLYDFWLCLIGIFVLLGASAEVQAVRHLTSPDGHVVNQDRAAHR